MWGSAIGSFVFLYMIILYYDLFFYFSTPFKFWTSQKEAQGLVTRVNHQQFARKHHEDLTIFIIATITIGDLCHHKWSQIR